MQILRMGATVHAMESSQRPVITAVLIVVIAIFEIVILFSGQPPA